MDFFARGGLRLAYRIEGPVDAPPLVLVNSLGNDLLDVQGIEQASICGLSLGGLTALWFVAQYP